MCSPFSLYKKKTKNGIVWYARFHDVDSGQVIKSRSTGIPYTGKNGRRIEAHKAAEEILETVKDNQELLISY